MSDNARFTLRDDDFTADRNQDVVPVTVTWAPPPLNQLTNYSPDQERDDHGRWSGDGGDSGGSTISSDGVHAFLEHSVNQSVTYHVTSQEAHDDMRTNGIDVDRSSDLGMFGAGFYTAATPEDTQLVSGISSDSKSVAVAVKLENPITGSPLGIHDQLKEKGISSKRSEIKDAMLKAGHDGFIVNFDDGRQWVIGYKSENIKLVEDAVKNVLLTNLLNYSPDQERDDHGRFGEGSGYSGTSKEISKQFSDKHRGIITDLSKADPATAKAIAEHLDSLAEAYPHGFESLGSIRIASTSRSGMTLDKDTPADTTRLPGESFGHITLNPAYYGAGKTGKLERGWAKDTKAGYHPDTKTDAVTSAITHEFGHVIEIGYNPNRDSVVDGARNAAWREAKDGKSYSSLSNHEAFGEAFMAYHHNPSVLSPTTREKFDALAKHYRGEK